MVLLRTRVSVAANKLGMGPQPCMVQAELPAAHLQHLDISLWKCSVQFGVLLLALSTQKLAQSGFAPLEPGASMPHASDSRIQPGTLHTP